MLFFTVGYGGRAQTKLLTLLKEHAIRTVVDVRLRPDWASMGTYVRAKTPDEAIESWLSAVGIGYVSLIQPVMMIDPP